MLTQTQNLYRESDGRYATDEELQFFQDYIQSFPLRLTTYNKIRTSEALIVQQVQSQIRARAPHLLQRGNKDLSAKWKQDTLRILRHSALALLIDDRDRLRDRLLLWFQTIMRAFDAQDSCKVTYSIMQNVVESLLTREEAALLRPILEYNRQILSQASSIEEFPL
ncbi:phycobilisome protein [Roseofilum reptotaenium CS-1145]|uniref:Phycobilisome protein n=1 Tax=Roseofilum reptotaenium AO1-A TaxID=1925591 RepID=A0A1L9QXL8_9CYAN|nr:phycobilisome protein [Roseofilum reptotaenium]MDB9517938.1 phycobilisome protein [Roseofilum reptotaenium CS-1145]OJJ27428.1 phycobilisome protein [Roseofilum reptotaenium AO1-A]